MVFIIEMNHNKMDLFLEFDQYVVMHAVTGVTDVTGYFTFAENSHHTLQTKLSQIGCDIWDICDTAPRGPDIQKQIGAGP